MTADSLTQQAKDHLHYLCVEIPNRSLGSPGNRSATAYTAKLLAGWGFETTCPPFDCLDWIQEGASCSAGSESFAIQAGPYSTGYRSGGILAAADTVEALEALEAHDKILLLHGEIAREQLMPKNFPFYNPEEHQRIYRLLEEKQPRAVLAATERNPELAGALYPFPLIEDGDFNIPSAYMTEEEGARLASWVGQEIQLEIRSRREPASGTNVLAFKGKNRSGRVVLSAHIDAKPTTPGALDNAAGVTTLLLLAELLQDYREEPGIELFIVNGEDHYSAAGEINYLQHNQGRMSEIRMNINLDGVGYRETDTAYSLYNLPGETAAAIRQFFDAQPEILEGEPWYQGDHTMFLQYGVPAMAMTSDAMTSLWTEIAHTPEDLPGLVDPSRLAELARRLHVLLAKL
jgi:aminopeptidase YwaD